MTTNGDITTKQNTPTLETIVDNSTLDRTTSNNFWRFLSMNIRASELLPPYWSKGRDEALHRFAYGGNFMGAFNKIDARVKTARWKIEPRDATVKRHRNLAALYRSIVFSGAEFGRGFGDWLSKWNLAKAIQDNGVFSLNINSDGKPLDTAATGMNIGLEILDSSRCTRTGDPIHPVKLQIRNGKVILIHYTRIMMDTESPSFSNGMNGVGFCALSRAVDYVQDLVDMGVYTQQKLGSRPKQTIIHGEGIKREEIADAFVEAEIASNNSGQTRYSGKVVTDGPPGSKINVIDLVGTGIFERKSATEIDMLALALAFGVPPRDLWIFQGGGLGAGKDSELSHITGSSGYQQLIDSVIMQFSGPENIDHPSSAFPRFLPPELKLTAELIDDQQQEKFANVQEKTVSTWVLQKDKGLLSDTTIRQLSLEAGYISQAQFENEELDGGRLPNRERAELLFLSKKPLMQDLLDIGFDDVLDTESNAANASQIITAINQQLLIVNSIIINSTSTPVLKITRHARAALEQVKVMYEGILTPDTETEATPPEVQDNETTDSPDEDAPTAPQTKQTTGVDLPEEVNDYEEAIANLIERGTNGDIDQDEFEQEMNDLVIEATTAMFLLGIRESGEDLTDDEREELAALIATSLDSIPTLAEDVFANKFMSTELGGGGNSIEARSLLWGGVLGGVFYNAMTFIREDTILLMWVWNPLKDHCDDCKAQNGQIRTVREWKRLRRRGIYPKSSGLACRGFYCGCGYREV